MAINSYYVNDNQISKSQQKTNTTIEKSSIEKGGPGSGRKKTGISTQEKRSDSLDNQIISDLYSQVDNLRLDIRNIQNRVVNGEIPREAVEKFKKDKLKEISRFVLDAPAPALEDLKDEIKSINKIANKQLSDNMKNYSYDKQNKIEKEKNNQLYNLFINADVYIKE